MNTNDLQGNIYTQSNDTTSAIANLLAIVSQTQAMSGILGQNSNLQSSAHLAQNPILAALLSTASACNVNQTPQPQQSASLRIAQDMTAGLASTLQASLQALALNSQGLGNTQGFGNIPGFSGSGNSNVMSDVLKLSTPVGQSTNDEDILVTTLHASASSGLSYKQALEKLHGVSVTALVSEFS